MRLDDYLTKIGVAPPLAPTLETLRRVHARHRETFLFENLTIQAGGVISLAIGDLERKFLDEGCGGYCFEHNTLLAAALTDLGFELTTLLGRVRRGPREQRVRTHMILRVPIDGVPWLADVGFGGFGLLEPIRLAEGVSSEQRTATYALRREEGLWVLSMQDRAGTVDLYEFTDDPQTAGDLEVANHYTATHPNSMFRRTLTIQRVSGDERTLLRSGLLVTFRDGRSTEQAVDRRELRELVRRQFDLELPDRPLVCDSYEPGRW